MKKSLAFFLLFFLLSLPCHLHSQQQEPNDIFSQAYTFFSQGNPSQAEDLFLKTLELKPLLEDYSLYFLGMISLHRDDFPSARNYFAQLRQRFPQSIWFSHTRLQLAKISLAEKNYQKASDQLQALRAGKAKGEIADEALYLLAQIYEVQGELNRAYSLYQELRHTSPLSRWAAEARKEVKRLREQHPEPFGLTTSEALSDEGELLLQEREYQEAEKVYRRLLDLVSQGSLRPRFLMRLANVYRVSRKRKKEIPILAEIVREYPETSQAPNALSRLAQIYWNRDENLKALDHFKQLKERYPRSAFTDFAYLASARIYESLGKTEQALRIYRDFSKRFPNSRLREEAAWRLAWIHYLQSDYSRAYVAFKRLAQNKGRRRHKTAALYWQARTAERTGRSEEAKQIFVRILKGEEDSYYMGPAARWLERMGGLVEKKKTTSRAVIPDAIPTLSPNLSFHLSRAQELTRISLNHLAVAELDEIGNLANKDISLRLILMREYAQTRAYDRSVVLAIQIDDRSGELDRYRYPLAYWKIIQKIAKERGLDPYLVLALIRQESLFDPKALSPASAFGLMQLLPSTAARAATRSGLPPPQPKKLFEPDLNVALGTHHLKGLLQRYSNNLVKAIAAYNAGQAAVARWEKRIPTDDDEEFIERIPYRETRLYVKLVLRNHRNYTRIYNSNR